MRLSLEVQNILSEAREMADKAGQRFTTMHLALGILTSTNRAEAVLADLKIDHKRILEALAAIKRADRRLEESDELLERVEARMIEAARRTDANLVSSLHLMMALTREKHSIAYRAFSMMGVPPAQIRTMALGRITQLPRSVSRRSEPRGRLPEQPTGAVAVSDPRLDGEGDPEPQLQPQPAPRDRPALPARPRTVPQPASPPAARPPMSDAAGDHPLLADGPILEEAAGDELDVDDELDPVAAAAEHLLNEEDFPLLTALGRNLTAEAACGRLDPVIGRDRIIDTMIDILNKRRSNNPCLVGEPGVGKTAIAEGLAVAMLKEAERVAALRDRVLVSLDVGALVAGTELRGSFSKRMAQLKDEVKAGEGRIIVFIDEIHTLVGAGSGDGALDAANDLKAALARGDFPCIGATTRREYHRYIERDPALERRFQPIDVPEPEEAEALLILQGIVDRYEDHHGVVYKPEALEEAVRMSRRYLVDRRLPDKAINLIDTAAARAVRHAKETVEKRDVAEVVGELAQIPVERLMMSDGERILGIRDFLSARVIGHDEVIDLVSDVIQRNSAGFASRRPIGSFLFLGPTGVGKTETAKVLADFLFCSKDALTRFDMSEFMERHSVSRLLGAAPGYVGHEEQPELTAALTRRPYQIVLFDEIEKAHADVLHVLLQILDEGQVTDTKGTVLSLSNTVVIMTSNLGAAALTEGNRRRIGFGGDSEGDDGAARQADLDRMKDAARKALPPELWGRIDEKCVFRPLSRDHVRQIARLMIDESSRRLEAERDIAYTVDEAVLDFLIDEGGWDAAHGARPMRRAVERLCETTIARSILRGEARPGDRVHLHVGPLGDELRVAIASPPVTAGPAPATTAEAEAETAAADDDAEGAAVSPG